MRAGSTQRTKQSLQSSETGWRGARPPHDLVPPQTAISRPATATGVASHPVSSRIGRCLCRTPSAPGSDNYLFFSCFWPWPLSDCARFSKARHASTACGRRRGVPPSCPLGQRARYVACSWEAHYVLIQIVSWGLLCLFRRAGESQPETCHHLQRVRAFSCARRAREIDVHQHVKSMPVNVTLASGVWAW